MLLYHGSNTDNHIELDGGYTQICSPSPMIPCLTTTPQGVSLVKLIEPPCTERYARWCERSEFLMNEEFLLLDQTKQAVLFALKKYHPGLKTR